MRKTLLSVLTIALLGAAGDAGAQGIHLTPRIGAYIPASSAAELRDNAETVRIEREGTLSLGLNLDMGLLRGSIDYASGARISEAGATDRDRVGDGSLLAAAAAVVIRPLPRLLVQPYALAGAGLKWQDYSYDRSGVSVGVLKEERSDFAFHLGIGADLMFGRLGVVAELTDYITRSDTGGLGQHDAFASVGIRIGL
jgi:hypothetical protein